MDQRWNANNKNMTKESELGGCMGVRLFTSLRIRWIFLKWLPLLPAEPFASFCSSTLTSSFSSSLFFRFLFSFFRGLQVSGCSLLALFDPRFRALSRRASVSSFGEGGLGGRGMGGISINPISKTSRSNSLANMAICRRSSRRSK